MDIKLLVSALVFVLCLLFVIVALVWFFFIGKFAVGLLSLSNGVAIGFALAWWSERRKERHDC